jgi:hypothetical protein
MGGVLDTLSDARRAGPEGVEQRLVQRLRGAGLQPDAAALAHQRRDGLHLQRGLAREAQAPALTLTWMGARPQASSASAWKRRIWRCLSASLIGSALP